MKSVIAILMVSLALPGAAGADEVWSETAHVSAQIPLSSNGAIAAAIDSAVFPLRFRRDASSSQHPTNLLRDLVAAYAAGTYALASLFQGVRPGCYYISVENFDQTRAGLAAAARAAIERELRASFGNGVAFFSDANCTHAL
jgi:hypothetical protein